MYMYKNFKQIGLDRVVLTVKETEIGFKGDDVTMINVQEGAIRIRHNAMHKDLLDISVNCPKLFYGTNEKNLNGSELYSVIDVIQDELEKQGLLVDVGNLKLGSFEVNYNVNDEKFYDVFRLIAKANVNDNLKAFYVENKDGIQSVKVKKQRYNVKIYKKSEHLKEQFEPVEEENVVRFEVFTNNDIEKAKIMGENLTLQGLIDNWERVERWYAEKIKLTIKKPVEKYIKQLEDECIALLERGVKPSDVVATLMLRQDLIDIVAFENAVRKRYKKIGKTKNSSRDVKTAHNRIKKIDEVRYNQVVGNVAKLEELYDLIGLEK